MLHHAISLLSLGWSGFYKDEFGMFVRSLVNWQAHISRVLYVMGLRQVPPKSKTKNAMNSLGG